MSGFYFFFIEIWPQEVYYITGLLILSAVALFLVTALFGRLWCGYACPQTVWTDLFIWVENLIEGDRSARIRLAAQPWNAGQSRKARLQACDLARHRGRHRRRLGVLFHRRADAGAAVRARPGALRRLCVCRGLLTFTTYSLGGLMREQVCTYMCPWPRIQAAMTDNDALSVTYRRDRGEPRGPHKKGQAVEAAASHCIDCNQCVAACPMGIDIRDGTQLECINCALCIDACDDVMDKVGLPRGLIAYDTDANVERRLKGETVGIPLRPAAHSSLCGRDGCWSAPSCSTACSPILHRHRCAKGPQSRVRSSRKWRRPERLFRQTAQPRRSHAHVPAFRLGRQICRRSR